MNTNINKKLEKFFNSFDNINNISRAILKYGSLAFLFIFASGTMLVVINRVVINYNEYLEFIATSIVKLSFTILAEAIIGGLLLDYIFSKTNT